MGTVEDLVIFRGAGDHGTTCVDVEKLRTLEGDAHSVPNTNGASTAFGLLGEYAGWDVNAQIIEFVSLHREDSLHHFIAGHDFHRGDAGQAVADNGNCFLGAGKGVGGNGSDASIIGDHADSGHGDFGCDLVFQTPHGGIARKGDYVLRAGPLDVAP